jgi:hypothetical protein
MLTAKAKLLQRRRIKYEKVNGRTTDAKTSHGPLGELKNDEKRAITPRQVDLDKLNMFSVYT